MLGGLKLMKKKAATLGLEQKPKDAAFDNLCTWQRSAIDTSTDSSL
jgi:hypothetical protein